MKIYVDIDETVCYYAGERKYTLAIPNKKNIEMINKLYDEGHTVVYWTARGSTTGIDWGDLTQNQLKEWGAKYTECKLDKPDYDLFICDKAVNSMIFFKEDEK